VIASGMTMVVITIVGYIFALGNSRQRSTKKGVIARCKELVKRCTGKAKKEEDEPVPQAPPGFVFVEQKRWTTTGKICMTVGWFAFPFNLLILPWAKVKTRVLVSLEEANAAARNELHNQGVGADGGASNDAAGTGMGAGSSSDDRVASGAGSSSGEQAEEDETETLAEIQAKRNAAEYNRMRALGACDSAEDAQTFLEMKKLEDQMANVERDRRLQAKEDAAEENQSPTNKLKLGIKKKEGRQGGITNFEMVLIQAQIRKKRRDLGWRGEREFKARLTFAWAVNMVIIPALLLTYSIACAVSLGEAETNTMCVSWLVAYLITFAIIEPVQVVLLAGQPWLCDEDSRCGRCCARVRFVYNELLAP